MKFILVSLLSVCFFSIALALEIGAALNLTDTKGTVVCPPVVTCPPVTICPHCEICPVCPTTTIAPPTQAPCSDDVDRVMSILKSSSNSGFDIKIKIKASSKSKTKSCVEGGKKNKKCDCNNNSGEGCC